VIVGPDGLAWVTDSGLNAIVSVHPKTLKVIRYPLPENGSDANLNTATFDADGTLWFTGQNGLYGALDPDSGQMRIYQAPRGPGPYGIHHTPDGEIWYASFAGNYIGRIDTDTGAAEIVDPPTADAGPRRIRSDSKGRLWVSEWNAGRLARYTPGSGADSSEWREWPLPGDDPAAYSVYVDENDKVWLSDFGANAVLRFDPESGSFQSFPIPCPRADVRQMLGRKGEAWAAESGCDHLTVYRYD
jgi:virginiamycin B lyase